MICENTTASCYKSLLSFPLCFCFLYTKMIALIKIFSGARFGVLFKTFFHEELSWGAEA